MIISKRRVNFALAVAAGLVLAGATGSTQNPPAPPGLRGAAPPSIPTGRQGRAGYPLPALPAVFETYQHKVRVLDRRPGHRSAVEPVDAP